MLNNATQEVNYRLSKWIIRNMEREQLLSPDEVKSVWEELLSFYSPPGASLENVGKTIRGSRPDDIFDRIPFRRKMFCDICASYYTTNTWHCVDRVWVCRQRVSKDNHCSNVHIYDYAFNFAIKQIMLMLISERSEVVTCCQRAVRKHLASPAEKRHAMKYLRNFTKEHPDNLDFGAEPSLIIERAWIHADRLMEAEFIDEAEVRYSLGRYSPKLGWWKEKPVPAEKPVVHKQQGHCDFVLSEEDRHEIEILKARRAAL